MIPTVSPMDVEDEVVHRQDTLVDFMSQIGPVHDELTLHALVYLAQYLTILDSLYEFDFSQNIPISSNLSFDLYDLVQKGVLVDTHRPGTIYVRQDAGKGTRIDTNTQSAKGWEILRDLSRLDQTVILALCRVSEVSKTPKTEQALFELLTRRSMVYPQYAEKAVKFCVERNLFGFEGTKRTEPAQ